VPRGVKGSGKGRKPAPEPGQPRRRGRKPKEALPEVVQPVESASELPPSGEPARGWPAEEERATEEFPAEEAVAEPTPSAAAPLEEALVEEALPAQSPELAAAEAELVRKYPTHRFKPGSLLPSGATATFGAKRSIVILCRDCGAERRLATSDIFHVRQCLPCAAQARKEARRATHRKQEQRHA
jgi:hypothetical protein